VRRHGGVDVRLRPLLNPRRGLRADARDLDPVLTVLGDDDTDFEGANVDAHEEWISPGHGLTPPPRAFFASGDPVAPPVRGSPGPAERASARSPGRRRCSSPLARRPPARPTAAAPARGDRASAAGRPTRARWGWAAVPGGASFRARSRR